VTTLNRADIGPVEVSSKTQLLLRDFNSQAKPAEITAKQHSRIGVRPPGSHGGERRALMTLGLRTIRHVRVSVFWRVRAGVGPNRVIPLYRAAAGG
jgi:hypothetical protein